MPPNTPRPHIANGHGYLDELPKANKSQEDDALAILRKRFINETDVDGTRPDSLYAVRDIPVPVGKTLCIRVVSGMQMGQQFFFTRGNILVGRSEDADITIHDSKISRLHLLIEAFSRNEIFLTDMASKNGTYVNRMRVRSSKLLDGDTIKVGDTTLVFSSTDKPY